MLKLIEPKPEDKPLLDRLEQLYGYDFSEIAGNVIGADGLYGSNPCFTEMWTDPNRFPRLIYVNDEPAGLALVHQLGERKYDMEQFFVMRKFRRSGIGRDATHQLFRAFPGHWTVEQITENIGAQAFWRNSISTFTNGKYHDTFGDDPVQSFEC
ncbi:hypothetical protein MXMO3_01346 [Maritalea myrionectae]|uniref:N-acetyltransferase domain-containing protein n=1 Tax=Maritalea myrionectae TaxID=454601 RepID=A0A2R4MCX3_9HYPH|nr:GNAT family N-acetyltransferase [Maritalea myrionectae]AVX03877.1 hypothetical protein MXMO3_01346 [Maritalea myrionectae]